MKSYHEWTEAEAREEAFRDDLERRYADDPAWWKWFEERQRAKRNEEADCGGKGKV